MATIFDVANYFLFKESMTPKKLQKLCYYAQSWHLAFYKEPLFNSNFEAWVHGPVAPEMYAFYKGYGWNFIPKSKSIPNTLNEENLIEHLDNVFDAYGKLSGDQLEGLTHSELPWQEAREELEEWVPSNNIISSETIRDFYWRMYESSQGE